MNLTHEDLDESDGPLTLSRHSPSESAFVDMSAIKRSGMALIAPLHVLLLGPLSIGTLAVVSAAHPEWRTTFAVRSELGPGSSDEVSVPGTLDSAILSAADRRDIDSAPARSATERLPAFVKRSSTFKVRLLPIRVDPISTTVEIRESGAPPGVPLPPTNLRVQ